MKIIGKFLLVVCMGLLCSNLLFAAQDSTKVHFAYDLNFDMKFDNREFDASHIDMMKSQTLIGARLSPAFGIKINGKDSSHKLMLGLDMMKNFGRSPISPEIHGKDEPEAAQRQNTWDIFEEITLYYQMQAIVGKKRPVTIDLTTGVFPKKFMGGEYSEAIFSDSLRFVDNNIEGILVSFKTKKAYCEIGCDWMGEKGNFRRERFMIFGAGNVNIVKWLDFSYVAYMYHYANSRAAGGVVDNHLINPKFDFKFQAFAPLQKLQLSVGALASGQNDRKQINKYTFPCALEVLADVRKWDVGIRNAFYWGNNMMPYYNNLDQGGFKYGNQLYLGNPMMRMIEPGSSDKTGLYDCLEIYYQPRIASFVDIRLEAGFHFNRHRYLGCQQLVSIVFHLNN